MAVAGSWSGRPLIDIFDELRASGISIVYSSQLVTPDMKVNTEPRSQLTGTRLQEALKPLGLTAKPLGNGLNGFAIVRSGREPTPTAGSAPTVNEPPAVAEEVSIYASAYGVAREDSANKMSVSGRTLENTPGAAEDALQAIHNFPGTASNSVSALAHVRGGVEDETLIQFDGIELYNPVHLKDFQGLFGLLDPEFVQSMNFFSGGYSARYGNHTSGMVDIEPRSAAHNNLIGASMLYVRGLTTGEFDDARGSWLFGYRRSSIPEVLNHLKRKVGDPDFEDYIGRMSYDWDTTKVVIGALHLNDNLRLYTPAKSEQTTAFYHDTYSWLRLEQVWNNALSAKLQVSQASLRVSRDGIVNVPGVSNGSAARLRDTLVNTAQTDWSYALSDTLLQWGARLDRASLHYKYSIQANFLAPLARTFFAPPSVTRQSSGDPQGSIYSAYTSARQQWHRWSAELGLRWDNYEYLDNGKYFSPRFNVQYQLTAATKLRFNAGRYVQARAANNLDVTAAVLQSRPPESSKQYVLGVEHQLNDALTLRIETYSKENNHVRPYSENVLDVITMVPELKVDRVLIAPQTSSARGVELSIASNANGPFNWWANYTWSRAKDRINGVDVPRSWDQPHALLLGGAYSSSHWKHSAVFSWHSGWPYTPLQIQSSPSGDTAVLGPRNSQRFGRYASLDLRSQYQVAIKGGALELFLELRNAFNQVNDCCREVRVTDTLDDPDDISIRQKDWLGWVPILGLDWRF